MGIPIVGFDTETWLLAKARQAPPMVCLSLAVVETDAEVIHRKDPACRRAVFELYEASLAKKIRIAGANTPYDLAVFCNEWPELLEPTFELLENDCVLDIETRQKLIDIAHGTRTWYTDEKTGTRKERKYSLKLCAERHGYPVDLDKDIWRLRYAEFDDIPVRDWPQGAIEYPGHDAKSTLWCANRQEEESKLLADQYRQMRAAWAMRLMSAWGIRTDRVMVERYRRKMIERLESHKALLLAAGMIEWNKKEGSFSKKLQPAQEYAAAAWARSGLKTPLTPSGGISCDEDAVTLLGDPLLIAFQEFGSSKSVLGKCDDLEEGIELPIHPRWDELLVTGRASSSKPPMANRPVEPDDRECIVPRRGNVFIDADYGGLELCTFAQVCHWVLGHSRLGEVLNAGGDPHAMIAAQLLNIPLSEVLRRKEDPNDEEVYLARQTGKVGNFGLGGGLGAETLIKQARAKYKVILTDASAKQLIATWRETWPEAPEYFKWINAQMYAGSATICQFGSERYRGDCSYTEACNTTFQGLGADATKHALWKLVRETYVGSSANLRECRVINYVHDQFITEAPEEIGHECALEKQRVIEDAANEWLPNVPVKAKPILTRRWSKLAKGIKENGRLVPWEWDEAIKAGSTGCGD